MVKRFGNLLSTAIAKQYAQSEFEDRTYQVDAVSSLRACLCSGRHAILVLPPGVGKTLIAQLTATLALGMEAEGSRKALILVPSTLLAEQHLASAKWLWPPIRTAKLGSERALSDRELRCLFSDSHLIVSTPEFLWRSLATNRLPFSFLDQFGLCVVDEYDEFVKEESQHGRLKRRLWKPAKGLIESLRFHHVPFLCMSAASPEHNTKAAYWLDILGSEVKVHQPPPNTYEDFIPAIRIVPCSVLDAEVEAEDARLTQLLRDSVKALNDALSQSVPEPIRQVTIDAILEQVDSVAFGRAKFLYVQTGAGGKHLAIPVTELIRSICQRIRQVIHYRLLLFEDMCPNAPLPYRRGRQRIEKAERWEPGGFHVELHSKAERVVALVLSRKPEPGVIFCRNVEVTEALTRRLREYGLQGTVIHGQVEPSERARRTDAFGRGMQQFLVVTRKLGGRGFDLPKARYAIFYSPKEDADVMWQETLRIRSLKKSPKTAYVLYYGNSAEENKYKAVATLMASRPESFLFSPDG